MSAAGRFLKRAFDILFSAVLIVLLSPLFLVVFLLLRFCTEGSVIYSQERIGKGGRPFRIFKFCTMCPDSEADGVPQLTCANDERFTPVGRWLSVHHLDELPQLWNVLRGDMSFVGPRPERQYFIDKIMKEDERYKYLYQIHPGVTSMATINNGYTDTMEKMLIRLQMDLDYLSKRSVMTDIRIICTTAWLTIMGKRF